MGSTDTTGSSTTTKDIAPKSADELGLGGMAKDILINAAAQAGYVIDDSYKSPYEQHWDWTPEYAAWNAKVREVIKSRYEDSHSGKYDSLSGMSYKGTWSSPDFDHYFNADGSLKSQFQKGGDWYRWSEHMGLNELNSLNELRQTKIREREAKIPSDIRFRKKGTEREEQIREKYGYDSQEYKDAITIGREKIIEVDEKSAKIKDKYLDVMDKLLGGDFAPTQQMKDEIQRRNQPIRDTINHAFDEISREVDLD